jgi:hypothetical protein
VLANGLAQVLSTGILLPASFLQSGFFVILSAFVAINTIVYFALAVAKILPKVYPADWVRGANRRSETRSIFPNAPLTNAPLIGEVEKPAERGEEGGHRRIDRAN